LLILAPWTRAHSNTNAKKATQQWYLKAGDSSIQLAGTQLCMDAGAQSKAFLAPHPTRTNSSDTDNTAAGNWKNMANILVKKCDATVAGQQWTVMEDGRIAVKASSPRMNPPKPTGRLWCANQPKTNQNNASISST
jgi:hypothetical protein